MASEPASERYAAHLPRMSIASAKRDFGLTLRALHFYEAVGLVEARRDRLNTRWYDPPARLRLGWISRLRRAGVTMSDIRDVLEASTEPQRRLRATAILRSRQAKVSEELVYIETALADVEAQLQAECWGSCGETARAGGMARAAREGGCETLPVQARQGKACASPASKNDRETDRQFDGQTPTATAADDL